jgi:flagellar basal-body rod modification protein FlgD
MEISAVGATVAQPATEARGLNELKSEDFFKILVTEMQNQDPFEPTKTADMISQVSQIRTIEQSAVLNDTLELLAQQQKIGGTTELIGKFVQAISTAPDGSQTLHEGVVTGVSFASDGRAVLELDNGDAVPATDVVRIVPLSELEQASVAAELDESAEVDESDESDEQTETT